MTKPWEFYENMNEIVYAANMDTYEMEYMNPKGCQMYGYSSLEDIKGKKCYEILQNENKPCDFCTNRYLKQGEFYEWKHFNEVLGKMYSSKDTMMEIEGKRFRMELTLDMTVEEEQKRAIREFTDNERMVNEGLKIALAEPTPEQSIESLLKYLGEHLQGERVYIFEENAEGSVDNTFEWCSKGVAAQIDNLQKVPFEVVSLWYDSFRQRGNVIIKDVEEVKDTDPLAYEYLVPQDIHSLVVNPIMNQDKIIGFYGVDNPPRELLNHISILFRIVGHFIGSLLKRRDLVKRLENLSMNDQMTQVGNRHAMHEYQKNLRKGDSVGIIYFDVMGLKKVNDTEGHQAGDRLLLRACECIKKYFGRQKMFRLGGDEFLVITKDIGKAEIEKRIADLKIDMVEREARMALGFVWEDNYSGDYDAVLAQADNIMYEDKRKYYETYK